MSETPATEKTSSSTPKKKPVSPVGIAQRQMLKELKWFALCPAGVIFSIIWLANDVFTRDSSTWRTALTTGTDLFFLIWWIYLSLRQWYVFDSQRTRYKNELKKVGIQQKWMENK